MNVTLPDKAYYRIGEVSKYLKVEPYVIRFWETEFKILKPVRASSGHRLYRQKDVEALVLIRQLLYEQRFTISGAKQYLAGMARETTAAETDTDRRRLVEIKKELTGIRNLIVKNK
ncbi:MAG: MerR family transcriptional regulator [Syntrophaceae bacterium]|nr:MerR family transcriptional regulator [Syntrophaceae bacterium]